MARGVDHPDLELADLEHLAADQLAVERGGEHLRVPRVAPDGQARVLGQRLPRPDVVPVAVGLHDGDGGDVGQGLAQALGARGGVHQQRLAGRGAGHDVDVVVHLLDRQLPNADGTVDAVLPLAVGFDMAGVVHGLLRVVAGRRR